MSDTPTAENGWKTAFVTVSTVVGLAIPLMLWKADLHSHSLSARLTSTVALNTAATASIPDVKLTIGGVPADSAYISTIVLVNDGSKPITAGDFEAPLEFSAQEEVQVIRASATALSPVNLPAVISTEKNVVKLKPLLLNPDDSIQIEMVTTGKRPMIAARARIAGVPKLVIEDETKAKVKSVKAVGAFFLGILASIMYPIFAYMAFRPERVPSGRLMGFGGALIASFLSALCVPIFLEWLGLDGISFLPYVIIMGFTFVVLARLIFRPRL